MKNTKRNWTNNEIEYLKENWGNKPINQIAKNLCRTETAIILKSKRLKLGSPYNNGDYMTANAVASIMGVDFKTVIRWINNYGLKSKKEAMRTRTMYQIKFTDLVKWLEKNQDKWDSRKLELFVLGHEPDWLKEKRIRDNELPEVRFFKWTTYEDSRAVMFHKRGFTHEQIADELGRSACAVERRLSRLDVKGDGGYLGEIKNKIA